MERFNSLVIQGSDGFVLTVRCGTNGSIPDCRAPLNSSHIKLMDLSSCGTKKKILEREHMILKTFHVSFFVQVHQPGLLFIYLWFMKTSDSTASWSAIPGLISTELTKVELSIRNRSKM